MCVCECVYEISETIYLKYGNEHPAAVVYMGIQGYIYVYMVYEVYYLFT